MKTFWTGIGGWSDQQLPDGTVIWTAPSGRTYTTHPGSRLFFPSLERHHRRPTPTHTANHHRMRDDRGLMMPRRKRTRAADIAAAIKAERALNERDIPPF